MTLVSTAARSGLPSGWSYDSAVPANLETSGGNIDLGGIGSISGALAVSASDNMNTTWADILGAAGASAGAEAASPAAHKPSLVLWAEAFGSKVFQFFTHTLPADADVASGACGIWYDQTNGAAHISLKAKEAGGTVRTGVIPINRQTAQASPGNPVGTASTVGVMMGLAGAITPNASGVVLIQLSGDIFNVTAIADGGKVQLRTGTGGAPANAAALTGTTAGGLVQYIAATTAEKAPFALQAIVSGLALGTAVWIDVGLAAITGGTATIENLSLTAVEL